MMDEMEVGLTTTSTVEAGLTIRMKVGATTAPTTSMEVVLTITTTMEVGSITTTMKVGSSTTTMGMGV